MAYTSSRTGGGRTSTSSLNRTGLGQVESRMNIGSSPQNTFGGVNRAFSLDDLRRAMRQRKSDASKDESNAAQEKRDAHNQANWDKRQQMSQAKEMMAFQQKLKSTASDQQRRKILELATQVGGDARTPGIQPRGAAATQYGMTQIAPYMSSLFGGQAGANVVGGSAAASGPTGMEQDRQMRRKVSLADIVRSRGRVHNQAPPVEGSREEGGGIPKTGIYQLHEGEQVIPAPEKLQEMVQDIIVDRQMGAKVGSKTKKKRGKKGKAKKSYEDGTDGSMEALMEMLGLYQEKEAPSPDPYSGMMDEGAAREEADVMDLMQGLPNVPGMPMPSSDIGSGATPSQATETGESMEMRQRIAGGDVSSGVDRVGAMEESLIGAGRQQEREQARSSQPEASGPQSMPGYEGELTESVGGAGERSFTLKGSEYTLEKRLADRYERDSAEIKRMNEGAESHARYAAQLLEYAGERPNSGANERLRQMAGDRMKLAKEMESSAAGRQKSLDLMVQAQGQQMAEKEAAGIEAQGRVGSAQVGAQGRVAAAREGSAGAAQGDFAKRLTELMDSYAGMEDADPEAREAALQQMMQLFLMMGEFQSALGGGV